MKAASQPCIHVRQTVFSCEAESAKHPPAARNESFAVLQCFERDAHLVPPLIEQLAERRLYVPCIPRSRLDLPSLLPSCGGTNR